MMAPTTKVSFQAAYRGLKDPPVGAPILDRTAQRRFAILVTLRQRFEGYRQRQASR
jgi:hypothetical protein